MSTTVLAVGVPAQGLTSLTSAVRRALAGRKFAGCALELFRRARFIDEVPVFGSRALRRGRARRVGTGATIRTRDIPRAARKGTRSARLLTRHPRLVDVVSGLGRFAHVGRPKRRQPAAAVPSFRELRRPARCE